MIRKWIAAMLALCLLGTVCLAEYSYEYYGTMMVDNCDDWVSLRAEPSTGAKRLAKLPLYAIVTDAEWEPYCGEFIHCCYDGVYGYILAKYLEPWQEGKPGEIVMNEWVDGRNIYARWGYSGEGEFLRVVCEAASGYEYWRYEVETHDVTELTQLQAFLGGAAQDPMVMVYNAERGLAALDVFSGELRWELTGEDLGAGISWATDGEGNTYIGGYYGPDPVAIDVYGRVKWRSDSQGCYWLYAMWLENGSLVCRYDVMDGNHELPGTVTFDRNGSLTGKTYGD